MGAVRSSRSLPTVVVSPAAIIVSGFHQFRLHCVSRLMPQFCRRRRTSKTPKRGEDCNTDDSCALRMPTLTVARPDPTSCHILEGSRDRSYYVVAMFLAARRQCCPTEPKFRFLLTFKVRFHKIHPIFCEANDAVPFISVFQREITHDPEMSGIRRSCPLT